MYSQYEHYIGGGAGGQEIDIRARLQLPSWAQYKDIAWVLVTNHTLAKDGVILDNKVFTELT